MSRHRHWHFTSESVAPGHPDKACDQIVDLIVDFFLDRDPLARVGAEAMTADRFLAICGEFRAESVVVDEAKYVLPYRIRDLLAKLYPEGTSGFDWASAKKTFELKRQSAEGVPGTDGGDAEGATDQGIMFGYACDETDELMPLPIMLANRMMERHWRLFEAKTHSLGSDAKCQITVRYDGLVPKSVDKVVLSTQHVAGLDPKKLREFAIEEIINHVVPSHLRSAQIVYMVNPIGRFVDGGPRGDTGLSGRKIVADSYGGSAPNGGGGLSGKDPSKMDRTGAYLARALAKGVVMAGLASRCSVQLAYAIGRTEPVSLTLDFHGTATGSASESTVEKILMSGVDMSPAGAIQLMDLRRPIYELTSTFGHFGREKPEFTWEGAAAQKVCDAIERALGEKS